MDHADDGAEQAQERGQGRGGVEHADVPLQVDELARGVVADRLADRRRGLAPVVDHQPEDPGDRAVVGPAQLPGAVAVELAAGEPIEESLDEVAGITRSRRNATSRSRAYPTVTIEQSARSQIIGLARQRCRRTLPRSTAACAGGDDFPVGSARASLARLASSSTGAAFVRAAVVSRALLPSASGATCAVAEARNPPPQNPIASPSSSNAMRRERNIKATPSGSRRSAQGQPPLWFHPRTRETAHGD